jgi:hypothetical protein
MTVTYSKAKVKKFKIATNHVPAIVPNQRAK